MTFAVRATLAVSLAIGAFVPSLGRATVLSPQPTERVEELCEGAATQVETLTCYLDAATKSRADVERAFEQNLRKAIALDRDFNADARLHRAPRSSLAAHLKASQAAWLRYSHWQCSFEGSSSVGGSGTDILEAACHYRLYSQRLSELRAAGQLLNR